MKRILVVFACGFMCSNLSCQTEEHNTQNYEMPNSVDSKTISHKQIVQLIEEHNLELNTELSQQLGADVYLLKDGRVILAPGYGDKGSGIIYGSLKDIALVEDMVKADVKEGHILSKFITDPESFISSKEMLIAELAKVMSVDRKKLDNSVESLKYLDSLVVDLGQHKVRERPILYPLITYVGEVMADTTKGDWVFIKPDVSFTYWEPWIKDAEGKYYNPYMPIYKELVDAEPPISIKHIVEFELSNLRLPSDGFVEWEPEIPNGSD